MNLQSKRYNVPSKDKLPPCSTWFRLKEERKIMVERKHREKQLTKVKEQINVAPLEERQPVAVDTILG